MCESLEQMPHSREKKKRRQSKSCQDFIEGNIKKNNALTKWRTGQASRLGLNPYMNRDSLLHMDRALKCYIHIQVRETNTRYHQLVTICQI